MNQTTNQPHMSNDQIERLRSRLLDMNLSVVEKFVRAIDNRQVTKVALLFWYFTLSAIYLALVELTDAPITDFATIIILAAFLVLLTSIDDRLPGQKYLRRRIARRNHKKLSKHNKVIKDIEQDSGFLWFFAKDMQTYDILTPSQRTEIVLASARKSDNIDPVLYFKALYALKQAYLAQKEQKEYETIIAKTVDLLPKTLIKTTK